MEAERPDRGGRPRHALAGGVDRQHGPAVVVHPGQGPPVERLVLARHAGQHAKGHHLAVRQAHHGLQEQRRRPVAHHGAHRRVHRVVEHGEGSGLRRARLGRVQLAHEAGGGLLAVLARRGRGVHGIIESVVVRGEGGRVGQLAIAVGLALEGDLRAPHRAQLGLQPPHARAGRKERQRRHAGHHHRDRAHRRGQRRQQRVGHEPDHSAPGEEDEADHKAEQEVREHRRVPSARASCTDR